MEEALFEHGVNVSADAGVYKAVDKVVSQWLFVALEGGGDAFKGGVEIGRRGLIVLQLTHRLPYFLNSVLTHGTERVGLHHEQTHDWTVVIF